MIDVIKELIANWDKIEKISSVVWDKIKVLFEKGDKQIGFIRILLNGSSVLRTYSLLLRKRDLL